MSISSMSPYAQSVMRIVIGFTFSCHGLQKLFGLLGGRQMQFPSLLWFGGIFECFGGILILVGLFTRPVAFLLCGEMAVAYFRTHAPRGLFPIQNGGELAVLYCFLFLYLSIAGPGFWSVDTLFHRSAKAASASR